MRLMGLVPFGKAFVKEGSSLSYEDSIKGYHERVWEEIAIRHNSAKAAIRHIMGPLTEEQYEEVVNYINYRLEQAQKAASSL